MASAKEEVTRRRTTRRDPRVDADAEEAAAQAAARDEVAPRARKRDPRADPDSIPPVHARSEAEDTPPADEAADEERTSAPVEIAAERPSAPEEEAPADEAPADEAEEASAPVDPRLAALEPLFDRSAWKEIAEKLGPPEEAAKLPPAHALIYALARREAAGDEVARGATELAIQSMAALLGVPPGSATALVMAKRLLRQNPASWRTRPAPPAKLSAVIIVIAVVIGLAAGSLLSLDTFRSIKLF